MVLGCAGEIGQILAADGQKDPCSLGGQGGRHGWDVVEKSPVIARDRRPGRAFQRDQRQAQIGAGRCGIAAHLRGKGVGGVDHMRDLTGLQIGREPFRPAKTAPSVGHGGQVWCLSAPGHRIDRREPSLRQSARHAHRIRGAAQQQDLGSARHG